MNIKDAIPTGFSQPRKRHKAFNANLLYKQLYGNWDEEEDVDVESESESEYEYYDARGEPILSTRIRPEMLHIVTPPPPEDEEEVKVFDVDMMINLNTGESCPCHFLNDTNTWEEATSAWNLSIENARKDQVEADKAAARRLQSEQIEKARLDAIVASLPRFSTAMLKRMEEAKNAVVPVRASSKFYKPVKGSKSTTSGQAWGHRRNGGGKGKKTVGMVAKLGQINMSSIRDEKYKKRMIDADEEAKKERKMTREFKKEKDKEEERKRQEVLDRIRTAAAALATVVVPVAVVEETEVAKRERERMEEYRRMIVSKIQTDEPVPTKKRKYEDEMEADFRRERAKEEEERLREERAKEARPTYSPKIVKSKSEKLTEMFYAKPVELCKSIKSGIPCRFGSRCKFSHDKGVSNVVPRPSVTRTRLCLSVTKGGRCRHGTKCLFAHTCTEFTPIKCTFGSRCRNVKLVDGEWVNVAGTRLCSFFHSGEDIDKKKMCIRIGMLPVVANKPAPAPSRAKQPIGAGFTPVCSPVGSWATLV
jgi:hypothetical protein